MTERRKLFGTTADKATKDKPVAREVGTVVGSAGIGLAGGALVHNIAKNSDEKRKLAQKNIVSRVDKKTNKYIKKLEKRYEKEIAETPTKEIGMALKKGQVRERADKIKSIAEKHSKGLEKVTKPLSKFAKTKKGKVALVGIPTAIIGGIVYKSTKKKGDKDDTN